MINFILNDKDISTNLPSGLTLLDFIRYHRNLMGTKIGCREGDCGACTVLVGELIEKKIRYRSMTSCLVPLGNVQGKHVITVEGINGDGLNPVQQCMAEEGATQCGFCTPGFVMSMAGYCLSEQKKSDANAVASVDGNICRCTGYKSIERAAGKLNQIITKEGNKNIFPEYLSSIPKRLSVLQNNLTIGSGLNSENKVFLSGGTDLYVQRHDAMIDEKSTLLFDRPELNGISKEGEFCRLGASVTVTDLCESEIIQNHYPQFLKYAKLVSSTPIRNMATIAGNFVNASPIGDFTIFFLALNAEISLTDGSSNRKIMLKDFYKGYKTLDKKEEEYISNIGFWLPGKNDKFNFEKVSKRTHLDIASVNSAFHMEVNGDFIVSASISAGGVGPVPKFLMQTSAFLSGKKISDKVIAEAIETSQKEISPISDARGSETYKRLLLSRLIKAHFIKCFPDKLNIQKILAA